MSQSIQVATTNNQEVEIYHNGRSARGKDFQHFNFPKLSFTKEIRVKPYRINPDKALEAIMARELVILAGHKGFEMVRLFRQANGKLCVHKQGDVLCDAAKKSEAFDITCKAAKAQIKQQLKNQATKGHIDCSKIKLQNVPPVNFTFKNSRAMLKAIIGGTQELTIFLSNINIDIAKRAATGTIRFDIKDDFGVDDSDLYSPSLIAFWILQHERTGYRPFVNQLIIKHYFIMTF